MDGKRVKTAREIQVEALIAAKSGFNADGKSDAYISGRFDRVEVAEVPVENPELVVEDERNTAWGRRLSKVKGWLRGVDRTASLESSDLRK